jgi:hypothetical protein
LCGVKWKGCSCPRFVEERLLEQVNGVQDDAADDVAAVALDAEADQDPLNDEHEHAWEREDDLECGSCGADYLPWVLRCSVATCRLARCVRCRDEEE